MHWHSDVIYPVAFFFGLILTLTWYGAALGRLKRRVYSLEQRVSTLEMPKMAKQKALEDRVEALENPDRLRPRSRVHPEQRNDYPPVGTPPPAPRPKRVRKPKPSDEATPGGF